MVLVTAGSAHVIDSEKIDQNPKSYKKLGKLR